MRRGGLSNCSCVLFLMKFLATRMDRMLCITSSGSLHSQEYSAWYQKHLDTFNIPEAGKTDGQPECHTSTGMDIGEQRV
jgi:hypothetical protein